MDDTAIRLVLRDVNSRLTNPVASEFISAFKPVVHNRRRSSSVNIEDRVPFCITIQETNCMSSNLTCYEDTSNPIDFTIKKFSAGDREEGNDFNRKNDSLRFHCRVLEDDLSARRVKSDDVERNALRTMQDSQQQILSLQLDVQNARQHATEHCVQCDKYKSDCEAASKSIDELKVQLAHYSILDADIKGAFDMQRKAAEVIKLAHESVKSLHSRTCAQNEEFHSQKQELEERNCEYQRMASKCHSLEQQNVDCTRLLESHEQELSHLNQTLELREQEIQELSNRAERQSRLITYQKAEHVSLLSELSVAQEVAQTVEVQLKDVLEAKSFLDQEHQIVSQELADLKVKFSHSVKENQSLSDQWIQLQQRHSDLLIEHNSASHSIVSLNNVLNDLHNDLLAMSGHWIQMSTNKAKSSLPSLNGGPHCVSASSSDDLIQHDSDPTAGCTNVDSDLCSTSVSQFPARVAEETVDNLPKTPINKSRIGIQSTPGFSAFRDPSTSRSILPSDSQFKVVPSALNLSDSVEETQRCGDLRLNGSIDTARTLANNVGIVVKELHQAVIQTVNSLNSQLDSLNDTMKMECASRDEAIRCARQELRELQSSASETKELADTATRELTLVRGSKSKLESDLKDARELLKQRADMNVECYDLTNSVKRLEKELSLRDSEVQTLTQTIQDRLKALESLSGREGCVKELVAENHRLKSDKTKLINSMSSLNAELSALDAERHELCRKNKLSSTNLRKAEAALLQLDDKVERIRKALLPYADTLKMADNNLLSVMNEIGVFADE